MEPARVSFESTARQAVHWFQFSRRDHSGMSDANERETARPFRSSEATRRLAVDHTIHSAIARNSALHVRILRSFFPRSGMRGAGVK